MDLNTVIHMMEAYPATTATLVAIGLVFLGWITGIFKWIASKLFPDKPQPTQVTTASADHGQALAGNHAGGDITVTHNTTDPETTKVFVAALTDQITDLQNRLDDKSEDNATLRAQIATLRTQLADPEKHIEAIKASQDTQTRLLRLSNEVDADQLDAARAEAAKFNYAQADVLFAQITARNELAVAQTANAEYGRAEIAEAEIRWADALTHYKRAYDLGQEVDALEGYARMAWRMGQYDDGIAAYEQLRDIMADRHWDDSAPYAAQLNNLALLYASQGRYAEAEPLYLEAREIRRTTLGAGHPDYASALNNLALLYESQGRYAEAEPLFQQAVEVSVSALGDDHPQTRAIQDNLAVLRQEMSE